MFIIVEVTNYIIRYILTIVGRVVVARTNEIIIRKVIEELNARFSTVDTLSICQEVDLVEEGKD